MIGGAGPGRVGAGRHLLAVRAVVAGGVQRQPLGPTPAAAPGAHLRLGGAAARPAQADQVEAPRRPQHRRSCASPRPRRCAVASGAERSSSNSVAGPASAVPGRSDPAATAAAPRPRASRRFRRRRGTPVCNPSPPRRVRSFRWRSALRRARRPGRRRAARCRARRRRSRAGAPTPSISRSSSGSSKASRRPQRSQIAWWWCSPLGLGRLVAGRTADVEAVDEVQRRQRVERAVDAREADGAPVRAQAVVDVLGAQAAVLAGEQREHLGARPAGAMAGAGQLALGVLGPFPADRCGAHDAAHRSVARGQMRISVTMLRRVFEAFSAPYMQRALAELLLLAVLAGVLGTWIVLRRLAFFTHAIGTATFPGLVVAGATGVAPQAAGAGRRRSASARGSSGSPPAVGSPPTRRPACCWSRRSRSAWCSPPTCSSSGAGVDRLLFGSLIGLSDLDVALTAAAVAPRSRSMPRCAAPGSRPASTTTVRARSAWRCARPTGCCSPPWRSRSSSRSTRSARCW